MNDVIVNASAMSKLPFGPDVLTVEVTLGIARDRIQNLLVSCFEGGYSPWAHKTESIWDASFEPVRIMDKERLYPRYDYPLQPGGRVVITVDNEDGQEMKQVTLDFAAIQRGIALMAKITPRHFTDFLREGDDATTGDVFVQLCVFGEVIYG